MSGGNDQAGRVFLSRTENAVSRCAMPLRALGVLVLESRSRVKMDSFCLLRAAGAVADFGR